ncbi:c-type cytochrome [Geobacter sp.]|uniref:c-type cytochrome n=1 Tax=Geobacter sp. TaxID=46610 RepID=UPI0026225F53|nr:c-type cytochrome [Geobacter sp.]
MTRGILRAAVSHLSLVLMLSLAPHAYGDAGKDLFDKQCSGCHTIGGGDAGGPDLKGITGKRPEEWLVKVIVEPDKLTAARDPVQLELVKKHGYEMPNLGISRDDALQIIAYLKGAGGGGAAAGGQPAAEAAKPVETVVTPELAARGRALFTGARPFAKGGAPCAACHPFRAPGVSGGNMATDLSDLYEGMGEQGLRGVLKSLKFPVMKQVYENRPLTEEEITAIVAFLKDAAAQKRGGWAFDIFPLAGTGFFAFCLAGLILYKRRTR